MAGKFNWSRVQRERRVRVHGHEPIAPKDQTLTSAGRPISNHKHSAKANNKQRLKEVVIKPKERALVIGPGTQKAEPIHEFRRAVIEAEERKARWKAERSAKNANRGQRAYLRLPKLEVTGTSADRRLGESAQKYNRSWVNDLRPCWSSTGDWLRCSPRGKSVASSKLLSLRGTGYSC